jgi:hypothetical protein
MTDETHCAEKLMLAQLVYKFWEVTESYVSLQVMKNPILGLILSPIDPAGTRSPYVWKVHL